jgi:L-rhamnonate dehydratase
MGFVGAKIPCPHGPCEGNVGLRKNVEYFKAARENVGEEFPLMLALNMC